MKTAVFSDQAARKNVKSFIKYKEQTTVITYMLVERLFMTTNLKKVKRYKFGGTKKTAFAKCEKFR